VCVVAEIIQGWGAAVVDGVGVFVLLPTNSDNVSWRCLEISLLTKACGGWDTQQGIED
jgi:hypothetical protein